MLIAALRAIVRDHDLPAAHRAMGFNHYWQENDAPRAIAAFKRALKVDSREPQTHFWYANVLADIGDHHAARTHYNRARLLAPGFQVIEVEAAYAEWQAGCDNQAFEQLALLAPRHPTDATVHMRDRGRLGCYQLFHFLDLILAMAGVSKGTTKIAQN